MGGRDLQKAEFGLDHYQKPGLELAMIIISGDRSHLSATHSSIAVLATA